MIRRSGGRRAIAAEDVSCVRQTVARYPASSSTCSTAAKKLGSGSTTKMSGCDRAGRSIDRAPHANEQTGDDLPKRTATASDLPSRGVQLDTGSSSEQLP